MADIGKTVEVLFTAETTSMQQKIDALNAKFGTIGDEAEGSKSKVSGLKDEVEDLGDNGGAKIDKLSQAFQALVTAAVVKEFIDANVQAERLNLTLTTLTGSTDGAAAVMDYIKGIANTLGKDVYELGNAFAQFMAATKGTSVEGESARLVFESFASTLSVIGKSTEDTSGVLKQLGQGFSKGKFELEDLQSVAERGVPIFNLMAESLGVGNDVLFDMISNGEITGEVMLKVAEKLNEVYGGVQQIDTFEAAWNRLSNTLKESAVQLGEGGVMDAAKKGIEGITLAAVGAVATFQLYGGSLANIAYTLANLDFDGYRARQDALLDEFGKTVEKTRGAFLGTEQQIESTGIAGELAGVKISDGMGKAALSVDDLKEQAKLADESLKKLGIDPKAFVQPFEVAASEIQGVIADLVNNPATSGDQLLAGLLVGIDKLNKDELPALAAAARGAFDSGKFSAEQFDAALYALATKEEGLWGSIVVTTKATKEQADALKKTQDETKKATDDANKYQLKLIEIASNEKIKVIEARFQLDIAEVEANAQIASAIISGIGETYAADVGLIGDLMSQVTDGYSFADKTRIAMAKESSQRTEELHNQQLMLIAAQVDYMRAKTAATSSGNPLVTIQADGLKPHLEAFMWEILGAIQVKMAYDGGDMLVGGCSL